MSVLHRFYLFFLFTKFFHCYKISYVLKNAKTVDYHLNNIYVYMIMRIKYICLYIYIYFSIKRHNVSKIARYKKILHSFCEVSYTYIIYESSGYAGDVSKKEEISEVINKILTEHKNVDILVNNAGITRDNLFLRMKNDEWEDVLRTNLNSLFYITQPISKRMINNRYGRIINISSIVGLTGNVGQANYSSSKAGVIGFTKSLAKELASRNITVNAIAPGFISSDMTDKISEQIKKNIISNIPAGRMGTPEEVANLACFLSSDKSGYINGRVFVIDGGLSP
ncbi:3-oxoacyl-[acyl-carrier-protein] reductase [Plasmodium falciparum Tanzania (2000708)]|uniref:3-oxoacyl-[acyl-carrier-protein] reductase n=1 Tax=Plasmodium falciparum Tanzania (2000708) TaxID=1036725 RepID=A0A024W841_PLAFA|nr:3-oxoacyl-[acyl-carrier-protein] reductase [Plasmodium falciparum Tanzania (2000708)]